MYKVHAITKEKFKVNGDQWVLSWGFDRREVIPPYGKYWKCSPEHDYYGKNNDSDDDDDNDDDDVDDYDFDEKEEKNGSDDTDDDNDNTNEQ